MIKIVEGNIFNNLPEYSVFLHQCNAKGWMGAGIAKDVAKRWPKAFKEYHEHCMWFKDGHENELLGTFVGVKINPKLIVCNAIAQETVGKTQQMTNYSAWKILCRKLEKQTRKINETSGVNWTIHAPYNIGCGLGGGNWNEMLDIFKAYFDDSPVELVFHKY